MIDKLDREDFNFMVFFKSTNVDVVALRNIEENSINEEKERLNI